ncbi:MAG: hypothetical protein ACRCZR_09680 [Cetobacterium sp.]
MKTDEFRIILEATKNIVELVKELRPTFGFIHKTEPIKYGEELGFLVWDYILYNEITFISIDKKIVQRLFTSTSDKETEEKFNKLVKQFKLIA